MFFYRIGLDNPTLVLGLSEVSGDSHQDGEYWTDVRALMLMVPVTDIKSAQYADQGAALGGKIEYVYV